MEKKTVDLHIRITPHQQMLLREGAVKSGKTVSEYLRFLIDIQKTETDPQMKNEIRKLRQEVNKIGVNINQVVRSHNSGLYSMGDKQRLITDLNLLLALFQLLLDEIKRR